MMGSYFYKGTLWLLGGWLSHPGECPEDFPEFFTTEDMEALNLPPDKEGMWRAQWQKDQIVRANQDQLLFNSEN